MAIPAAALDLIKSFEGYLRRLNDGTDRVRPYLCPAGVPTIGWGTTRYPDNSRVTINDSPISAETATGYLAHELSEDEAGVDRYTTRQLHELSRGSLVSFVYNCGSGAYKGSNLRRAVNEGRWADVPAELRKWRMGGGRVLPGLVRRREAEAGLFMTGVRQGDAPPPEPAPVVVPMRKPQPKPPAPARSWLQQLLDRLGR